MLDIFTAFQQQQRCPSETCQHGNMLPLNFMGYHTAFKISTSQILDILYFKFYLLDTKSYQCSNAKQNITALRRINLLPFFQSFQLFLDESQHLEWTIHVPSGADPGDFYKTFRHLPGIPSNHYLFPA